MQDYEEYSPVEYQQGADPLDEMKEQISATFEKEVQKAAVGILDQWEQAGEVVMTPELKSIIKKAAITSAIIAFLPLFGVETIINVIVLWRMYHKIAKKIGLPFAFGQIGMAIIINIAVSIFVNVCFDGIIGIGWVIDAVIIGLCVFLSGKAYLGALYTTYKQH